MCINNNDTCAMPHAIAACSGRCKRKTNNKFQLVPLHATHHMKCSAVASVSNSSTLKNSSWPLRPFRPASTTCRPRGDQYTPLQACGESQRGAGRALVPW